jgi:hypothetical protein
VNCPDRVGTGASPVQAKRSSAVARQKQRPAAIAIVIVTLICLAHAQDKTAWHYDLLPGDHLTYRYTFHRQGQSDEAQLQTEARFRTHVLVTAISAGRISLGFQRNRESAELTQYRSKGKDKLAQEQVDFNRRMQKRPSRFSEAMEISPTGEPRYPWEVAREAPSHLLDSFHEVMNLPPMSLAKGEAWRGSTLLGLDIRWVDDESIHGKLCHHLEAALSDKTLKLSYWWSPETGVLEKVALDGSYLRYGASEHETAEMELESRTRGEQLETWVAAPDTRLGALQAILLTPESPVTADQLAPVLTSGDPASQALALAIASRRKIEVRSDILRQLRQSPSAQVQEEVRVLIEPTPTGNRPAPADQCHRTLPVRSPPAKFGTVFEVAPATKENPAIPYLMRIPPSYHADRPTPLLIYLSGGGGFALDAVNSAEDVVSQTDYLVLYPQAADYWWKPEIARRFDVVLSNVLRQYNVDRDRIYLTGFSNGGTGALYFATLWPQRFAAIVSMMGAGQCNEQVKAGLSNLGNLPLLFVHGADDPLMAPACSTTTHAALTDLHPPVKPLLRILPNRAHDIGLDSDDGLALAFFKDKLRNPFPREVNLIESDALAAQSYWIEILDGRPGKSAVEARVKTDNTIEIHSHDVKKLRLYLRPELLPKPGDLRIVWNGKKLFNGPLRDPCALSPLPTIGDPKFDVADTQDLTLP